MAEKESLGVTIGKVLDAAVSRGREAKGADDESSLFWVGVLGASLAAGFLVSYILRSWYDKDQRKKLQQRAELRKKLLEERIKNAPPLEQLDGPRTGQANQGMRWVRDTLRTDGDGDRAHMFLGPFSFPNRPEGSPPAAAAEAGSNTSPQQGDEGKGDGEAKETTESVKAK